MLLAVQISVINCLIILLMMVLYAPVSWICSILFKKEVRRSEAFTPPVSIIIACHNEVGFIRQKLESFLAEDEWIPSSEIIVVSNGSTDGTNDVLAAYSSNPDVHIIIEKYRISKILAVNKAVKLARHEMLIFSDCRQQMEKGSIKSLLMNFNDPDVGTVTSKLIDAGSHGKHSFRTFLNFMAACDGAYGSALNVFGALYAQRKSVFRQIPAQLLFDDLFVIVSTILQGKRLIMDQHAVIYDVPFNEYYLENRIQRLARGLLIFLFTQFRMMLKLPFTVLIRFMVFKYFKLLLPFVFIILSIDFVYFMTRIGQLWLCLLLPLPLLMVNKAVRKYLIHFIRINYHFLLADIKYLFLNYRSNKWEKLKM